MKFLQGTFTADTEDFDGSNGQQKGGGRPGF
jgi:hypothetical protein